MSEPTVTDNAAQHRYELTLDGRAAAWAVYELQGKVITFVHTEVDKAHEGQGLGSQLAKAALDDVKAKGLRVVPKCPFIKRYIEKHAEYAGLVDGD